MNEDNRLDSLLSRRGTALESTADQDLHDAGSEIWEERRARGRFESLGVEISDISEVEYRQVRLEKVVLVGLYAFDRAEAEISLRELAALAETAGAQVLDGLLQRRQNPDPGTYLGRGKAAELADLVAELGADTVVVDTELTPSSRRALEDVVKVKVVDRTAIILDIFAQHATSREGKAQVELAQLEYLLPRLRGWGESMSRQAGGRVAGGEGIGSRGPGETKIELDRRRIRTRIARLRRQLKEMAPARENLRAARQASVRSQVAIVGYTNAGKSSVLNRLTKGEVLVHDALFATLDTTVRQSQTPDGRIFTLADTVGFVRKLPHQLVEAFRSTLEEIAASDLILHVVDGAHPDPLGQIAAVNETLAEIPGVGDIPQVIVINKVDVAQPESLLVLRSHCPGAVEVSALSGQGFDHLRERIAAELPQPGEQVRVILPWKYSNLLGVIREEGRLVASEIREAGTLVEAWVGPALAARLRQVGLAVEDSQAVEGQQAAEGPQDE